MFGLILLLMAKGILGYAAALGGLALLPFAIGNMLPADEETDGGDGDGEKPPSPEDAAAALKDVTEGKEEQEELFETEGDEKVRLEEAEKVKAAESAPDLDSRLLLAEMEKTNPALKGRFKDVREAIKAFTEREALLARVTEHYGMADPAALLSGLLNVNLKAAEAERAAAKSEPVADAGKPAELTPAEKVFVAKVEKELGFTEDLYREMKDVMRSSFLADPAFRTELVGDFGPKLKTLEDANAATRWDGLWSGFQVAFPVDKHPEVGEMSRQQMEHHLKQNPELIDLAIRKHQNPFAMAAVDLINQGGLAEILTRGKKDAHEAGADSAKRLQLAEHASGKVRGGKEEPVKPGIKEEDETPDDILKKAGMTTKDAENWLTRRT